MVISEDEVVLLRITGLDELPPDIVEEYTQWAVMHHRLGFGGPIGALACIAIVRSLGYEASGTELPKQAHDWGNVELGTEILVPDGDGWKEGRFAGLVMSGVAAVRFEGDEMTREFPLARCKIKPPPKPQKKGRG